MKVLERRERIDAAGGTVVTVVHDEPEDVARACCADSTFPIRCSSIATETATGPSAWVAARWREMWSPGAVWPYARALVKGQRIDRPGRHPRQLGGDFVVDPEGRVAFSQLGGDFVVDPEGRLAFSHPQASSDDRPPVGGSSSVSRRSPGRGRPTSDDIGGGPSAAGVRRGACGYPPERAGDRREAP